MNLLEMKKNLFVCPMLLLYFSLIKCSIPAKAEKPRRWKRFTVQALFETLS
jgi:hypothetical protein